MKKIFFYAALVLVALPATANSDKCPNGVPEDVKNAIFGQALAHRYLNTRLRKPPAPFSAQFGPHFEGGCVKEAYDIQEAVTKQLLQGGAGRAPKEVVGWKVGFTSKASQDSFGADRPAYSPILREMVFESDSQVSNRVFNGFAAETEVAFIIEKTIDRHLESVEELFSGGYVSKVGLGLEVANVHFSAGSKLSDYIADYMSSQVFVKPLVWHEPSALPPSRHIHISLWKGGEKMDDANTADALEGKGPWEVLRQLSNDLIRRGSEMSEADRLRLRVRTGDIVFTGNLAGPFRTSTPSEMLGSYSAGSNDRTFRIGAARVSFVDNTFDVKIYHDRPGNDSLTEEDKARFRSQAEKRSIDRCEQGALSRCRLLGEVEQKCRVSRKHDEYLSYCHTSATARIVE